MRGKGLLVVPHRLSLNDVNAIVNKVVNVTSGSGRYKASKVVVRGKDWNMERVYNDEKREDCQREKGDGEKWTKCTRIRRSSMERMR